MRGTRLLGEGGSDLKGFLEEAARDFQDYLKNKTSLVIFLGVLALVAVFVLLRRAFAPRAQRLKEIDALFEALVAANGLSPEERRRVEEMSDAAMIENPAHLFVRPTVWDAATRALLDRRPKERDRLSAECEQLKRKLLS